MAKRSVRWIPAVRRAPVATCNSQSGHREVRTDWSRARDESRGAALAWGSHHRAPPRLGPAHTPPRRRVLTGDQLAGRGGPTVNLDLGGIQVLSPASSPSRVGSSSQMAIAIGDNLVPELKTALQRGNRLASLGCRSFDDRLAAR